MKFTYNWLKDFVDIKVSARQLAEKLTMAGLEVESIEQLRGDFVFEAEVTSNRPDCLSIIGIAREAAAITGARVKLPKISGHPAYPAGRKVTQPSRQAGKSPNLAGRQASHQDFVIEIEDKKDCPLYTAKIIKNVKVGPSPAWLKERLELIGCRSINNVVDITNYIMFTWGQPLHAFDLDKLKANTIVVRRAKHQEKLMMIDGQEKILDPDILVIADKNNPVAIAGIMGGKDAEVSDTTRNVLLESAIFNPVVVRCAKRKLGLESESAYRFERGVDLEKTDYTSGEASRLIEELAKGEWFLSKSSAVPKTKAKSIILNVAKTRSILGIDKIAAGKIKKILQSLGFQVKAQNKNNLKVSVPSYRPDVNLEEDLFEEIARIFGYENIPVTLPAVIPQLIFDQKRFLVSQLKNILVGLGLNEVITHSLIAKDLLKGFQAQEAEQVEILNPLSKEQEILRPTIIPSLLKCASYNLNQKQTYLNIFEIADTFSKPSGANLQEELKLGLVLCGAKPWLLTQGLVKEELGFLHLKGTLEVIFQRLGIKDYGFKPVANAKVEIYAQKEKIGTMISVANNILDNFDIKNKEVVSAEISLARLFTHADLTKKFSQLPIYPGISRDISFVLKEEVPVEEVLRAIKDKAGALLRQVNITDYYKGKQIPDGFRGLTISCLYRSDERTLTEVEISPLHAEIAKLLVEKFSATIR